MIYLGLDDAEKNAEIARYCAEHDVHKVFVFSADRLRGAVAPGPPREGLTVEHIEWAEIQMYRTYYRLIQEIDGGALLVFNESLRTQARHDLTYNCLRNFTRQTGHQLIFSTLPLIDTAEDFMILFDLDTRSQWRKTPFDAALVRRESQPRGSVPAVELHPIDVATDDKTRAAYAAEKRKLIDNIGHRDPHTIPRNLYLMGGRAKLAHVTAQPAAATTTTYLGRNQRLRVPGLVTYAEPSFPAPPYTIFELPHDFGDLADFLTLARQPRLDVLVADLKVDRWYLERFTAWTRRIADVGAALLG